MITCFVSWSLTQGSLPSRGQCACKHESSRKSTGTFKHLFTWIQIFYYNSKLFHPREVMQSKINISLNMSWHKHCKMCDKCSKNTCSGTVPRAIALMAFQCENKRTELFIPEIYTYIYIKNRPDEKNNWLMVETFIA